MPDATVHPMRAAHDDARLFAAGLTLATAALLPALGMHQSDTRWEHR